MTILCALLQMHPSLLLLTVTASTLGLKLPDVIVPGPQAGILLKDEPGFLVADAQMVTHQVYVALDPLHVIRRYQKEPIQAYREETKTWYEEHLAHTRAAVKTSLRQLERTAVYMDTPDNSPRSKRAIFGVFLALAGLGSLLATSMSVANSVSLSTLKSNMDSLQQGLGHIKEEIKQQQLALQGIRTTIDDTVLVVNLHGKILDSTITQVQVLTNSLNEERTFREPVRLLTSDLLREVGLGINDLIQGRIPTYLVNETVVRDILQRASPDKIIDTLQIRIAYNLGAAVPLFVDVENMHVAFMVSLPFIRPENVYQLKTILNVGAWNGSYLTTINTPPVVAYQDKFTQYLVPNLKLCKKAKDLHWLCPGKPFVKDTTEVLCGLTEGATLERCQLTVAKSSNNETRVAIADGRWLVNTPLSELTISYSLHHSITKLPITPGVSLVTVPEGSVIHIGDTALYYLDHRSYQAEIELVDVFRGHELAISAEFASLLATKNTHSLEVTVGKHGLVYDLPRGVNADLGSPLPTHAVLTLAGAGILGLVALAIHSWWLHKRVSQLTRQLNNPVPAIIYQANVPNLAPTRINFSPYQ